MVEDLLAAVLKKLNVIAPPAVGSNGVEVTGVFISFNSIFDFVALSPNGKLSLGCGMQVSNNDISQSQLGGS
jgi:hypothetical protein